MSTKEISKKETLDWPFLSDFPSLRDWFEDFAPERFGWMNSGKHAIKVEELIRENEIVVRAELPGIDPDKDVHIHVNNGMLTITGERQEETSNEKRSEFYYGSFTRMIPLPAGTTEKGVKATYKDGILEVHVPTPELTEMPKRIPIHKM
jgi:HSP20 family molecular chaperone IbpA